MESFKLIDSYLSSIINESLDSCWRIRNQIETLNFHMPETARRTRQ